MACRTGAPPTIAHDSARSGAHSRLLTRRWPNNGLLAAGVPVPATFWKPTGAVFLVQPGRSHLWWAGPAHGAVPGGTEDFPLLRKVLKRGGCAIRVDGAFREVMEGCAEPRCGQPGTWIHPAMIGAYARLHEAGHAHSVETWIGGQLAGGLYGVALGRAFFGESMFSRATNASKIALAFLTHQLSRWRFGIIDCQMQTSHLASLGAREIPRSEFSLRLTELVNYPAIVGRWQFDHDISE